MFLFGSAVGRCTEVFPVAVVDIDVDVREVVDLFDAMLAVGGYFERHWNGSLCKGLVRVEIRSEMGVDRLYLWARSHAGVGRTEATV